MDSIEKLLLTKVIKPINTVYETKNIVCLEIVLLIEMYFLTIFKK